jgi:hypothetical protein
MTCQVRNQFQRMQHVLIAGLPPSTPTIRPLWPTVTASQHKPFPCSKTPTKNLPSIPPPQHTHLTLPNTSLMQAVLPVPGTPHTYRTPGPVPPSARIVCNVSIVWAPEALGALNRYAHTVYGASMARTCPNRSHVKPPLPSWMALLTKLVN